MITSSVKTVEISSHRGCRGSARRRPERSSCWPPAGHAGASSSPHVTAAASCHRATAPPGTAPPPRRQPRPPPPRPPAATRRRRQRRIGHQARRQRGEHRPDPLRPPGDARSQPRTVEAGRPSRSAITRCPAPAAFASSARPITSPASARRARHHAGSSTIVAPHPRHRDRRGTSHACPSPSSRRQPHPPRDPFPTGQHAPARRARQLPARQLPSDHIPVSVYREHDASARQPSGPPVSGCQTKKKREGRARPTCSPCRRTRKRTTPKGCPHPVRTVSDANGRLHPSS